ncbi:sugar ABC transporter substrate-binding protein, partial [Streptomyces sp. SID7760]|nr:sugar ABC transporter substrate-binding protein [Streptomyces sp. SID7760]MYT27188.1 sugar ABC transporter substrate-binding protein [Streptomyces sp. SID7760]
TSAPGAGDPSAFRHNNSGRLQAATIPEPLSRLGRQIVGEFNRAFAGRPACGNAAPLGIATAENGAGAPSRDPEGYEEAYEKVWHG